MQCGFPETDPAHLLRSGHDQLLHQNVFGIRQSEGPRPTGLKDFSRLLPRITRSNGDRERSENVHRDLGCHQSLDR